MDASEVLDKLLKGEIKLYEVEQLIGDVNKAAEIRRTFLEKVTGAQLKLSLIHI